MLAFVLSTAIAAQVGVNIETTIQSATEAERYEAVLQANPEDLGARSLLLAWYVGQYDKPAIRPVRLGHILWTIEHHPDMRLSDSRSLSIDERLDEFRLVRQAWLDQVKRQPSNAAVLLRAAGMLSRSDRELAAGWLKQSISRSFKK